MGLQIGSGDQTRASHFVEEKKKKEGLRGGGEKEEEEEREMKMGGVCVRVGE